MKKILSLILAMLLFLSAFPLFVFAEHEIPEGYSYVATYYYDKNNPNNTNVIGKAEHAYKCYDLELLNGYYQCLFTHSGTVVKDEAIVKDLSKMYFANNWQKIASAQEWVITANELIPISDKLKLNSFVDGFTTLASECLGTLSSIYFTGGSATGSEILNVVTKQATKDLKESLFDVSNIISKLHLTMLHNVADEMEECILQIRAMNPSGSEFMYYKYCNEFCTVFSELERLTVAESKLISQQVKELEPNLIKNLAHYFGIAANNFVGGFAEFLTDLDKIEELKNTNPKIIADAIELASRANDLNNELSDIKDIKELSDNTDSELKNLFSIFEAYTSYEKRALSIDIVSKASRNVALEYHYNNKENNSNSESTSDNTNSGSTSGGTTSSYNPINNEEIEFTKRIEELKKEYPHGKYWSNNNGTVSSGIYQGTSIAGNNACSNSYYWCNSCGTFKLNGTVYAWQCYGYAYLLAHKIFGSNAYHWPASTNKNTQIYAGDLIRIDTDNDGIDDTYDHTIFVYKVTDTDIYYTDCNYTAPCQINWQGQMKLTDLRKVLLKVMHLKGNTLTGSGKTSPTLTINYNANGGSIPTPEIAGEIYKVTHADGLNVRAKADENSTKLGAIRINTSVTVTEKKTGTNFVWGKIAFNGGVGWIALDSSWITKTGTTWDRPYCVSNGQIFKTSSSSIYTKTYTYGGASDSLDKDTTFGLYRDGYTFKGWSLSASGGELIDPNKKITADSLAPSATNGNKTLTLYAVWEQNAPPVTDFTVKKIYLSSIPQKSIYYVGEAIDKSSISIIVEHTDGSFEEINSGFICTPSTVTSEGSQTVTVTYEGKTASFNIVATKPKTIANNATSKVDATGYFLPSSSSGTLFNIGGSYKNDVMQILCKDGDYYLCLFPWNASTTTKENAVMLYFKASEITANGSVPSAAECFSMNPTGKANATVLTNTKIYYRPDGGAKPVTYGGKTAAEATVTSGMRIRVLFEMEGYYCVQTDKNTGFVSKSSVKLDPVVYTLDTTSAKISVQKGETINTSSIALKSISTDGTETEISIKDCILSLPSTESAGQKKAVITYGGMSTLVDVVVVEHNIKSLTIDKLPQKMAYAIGESFDPTGISVMAVYDDGKSENVNAKVKYEYSFDEEGDCSIRIKYEDKEAFLPVKVYEKPNVHVFDSNGYAGQTVFVPIYYFANEDVIVPADFEMTISYDAAKINYVDVENSELYSINTVDADTLKIKYVGNSSISDGVLATLEMKLSTNDDRYGSLASITVDKLDLSDSLGNKYATNLAGGSIFNLGQIKVSLIVEESNLDFATINANYGESVTIPSKTPTLDGYTFAGWSLPDVFESKLYQEGETIEVLSDLCLVASWKKTSEGSTSTETEIGTEDKTEDGSESETNTDPETDTKDEDGINEEADVDKETDVGKDSGAEKEPDNTESPVNNISQNSISKFISSLPVTPGILVLILIGFVIIILLLKKKR